MNKWREIWEKRTANLAALDQSDYQAVFAELKRINGFDIADGGIPLQALLKQYADTRDNLQVSAGDSLFEVGCGCGANLYMFQHDGIQIGGLDYSTKLIAIMLEILGKNSLRECICSEAANLPVDLQYDALLSNSVFSYFADFAYAEQVLEKMVLKARKSIGLLDVHDEEKKQAFLDYRRQNIAGYEERYKDLPKLFYPRTFFQEFAVKHQWKIVFYPSDVDGYWNNDFIYNVYLYK